jgi:hypothetical protein
MLASGPHRKILVLSAAGLIPLGLGAFALHTEATSNDPLLRARVIVSLVVIGMLLALPAIAPARERWRKALCAVVCVLGLAVYYQFGVLRGGGHFVHELEHMHYLLGSKYFPELGYDGLYVASAAAQHESAPARPMQPFVRDLTKRQRGESTQLSNPHMREVVARFQPERWQSFVSDHQYFLDQLPDDEVSAFRMDHGYNATPPWTFLARAIAGGISASSPHLVLLGLIDVALLGILLAAILWTFGWSACAFSAALFGLGFGWQFLWIGGAFLRLDWLVAVVLGICALERGRFTTAGVFLAWASLSRLFPVVFLMGPTVLAVRSLLRKERPRWFLRLAAGYALTLLAGLGAGALAGRGAGVYADFSERILLHKETWSRNHVGLESAVLLAPILLDTDPASPRLADVDVKGIADLREKSRVEGILLVGVFLLLVAAAQWRESLAGATALGAVAVFALMPLSCYYWSMFLVLPLCARGRPAALAVLILSALLFSAGRSLEEQENVVRYVILSTGLAAILFVWLLAKLVPPGRGTAEQPAAVAP